MHADFLLERFRAAADAAALVWRGRRVTYAELIDAVARAPPGLAAAGVAPGAVVALEADFSPVSVAHLLALVDCGAVVVPLSASVEAQKPGFLRTAQAEHAVRIGGGGADAARVEALGGEVSHPLLVELRRRAHPGLVLFSSGSTGESKAALHDFLPLLDKFRARRHVLRTLAFLLFDHIGGVNTLFYTLSNAGCVVTVEDRSPDAVCAAIAAHRVQLLPTSPTFLNLLLLSGAHERHDLSSLELVTYGTEVMPESTLARIHALLPHARLLQTYGLSEVGILRSKSKASDSLFVKIGGEGFDVRVVDGQLEIRAESAMLGYLNAPSPFTADGWLRTGDAVIRDGEYLRILGRGSEIINVGGEKVYPAEVESVLQEMPGVAEVAVCGEPNPITGQIVSARVVLAQPEALGDFRRRMRAFCRERLPRFKVPQKVELSQESLHGQRYKKMRRR